MLHKERRNNDFDQLLLPCDWQLLRIKVVGMAVDLEVLGWTLALVFVMAGCVMWMGLCDVPICGTQFLGVNVNEP